jgi:hypothetical protein
MSTIRGNIMFNGPRAGVNFNDHFGGANSLSANLIFNVCRFSHAKIPEHRVDACTSPNNQARLRRKPANDQPQT